MVLKCRLKNVKLSIIFLKIIDISSDHFFLSLLLLIQYNRKIKFLLAGLNPQFKLRVRDYVNLDNSSLTILWMLVFHFTFVVAVDLLIKSQLPYILDLRLTQLGDRMKSST